MSHSRLPHPVVHGLVLGLMVLALFSTPCFLPEAFAQPAVSSPPAAPKLSTFKSRFYTVHTNLTAPEARPIAEHMDTVYLEYRRRFASFKERAKTPMNLYLVRTQADYMGLLAANEINGSNTGGMFFVQGSFQGLATFVQGRSLSATYAVLQHEGFHQFAYRHMGTGLPIWVNEGLAQYFEDGIITKAGMTLGMANARRVNSIRAALNAPPSSQTSLFSLDDLLKLSNEEWRLVTTTRPQLASLMYDQAWSVVHFLIHGEGGRYRPALEKYLGLVSMGKASNRAFAEAFGADNTTAFEKRWREYALKAEPDALNQALGKMEFLGGGLRFLSENNMPAPKNIDELKKALQLIRFRFVQTWPGVRVEWNAADESAYTFVRNKVESPFQLLEPSADDLPPRLTAPGLKPEPTLIWSRDNEGKLVQDVQYR